MRNVLMLVAVVFMFMGSNAFAAQQSVPAIDNPTVASAVDNAYDESFVIFDRMVNFFRANPGVSEWTCPMSDYSEEGWMEFGYRIKEQHGNYSMVLMDSVTKTVTVYWKH